MGKKTKSEESDSTEDWRKKKLLNDIATLGPDWREAIFVDICNKDTHCYGKPGTAERKKIQRLYSYLSERNEHIFESYYKKHLSEEEIKDFEESYKSEGKGYLVILL
jgi:hypothetical protein